MGNQPGKLQNRHTNQRPKKNVHWKTAEHPSPPGRPILIPLTELEPDVITLRWERPKLDGGSAITGYIVEHRRMGSPHWVKATPLPTPRCELSISGLEPGWRYQFRVFAENIVGRSEPSELSDILTVTLQRNAICAPRFLDELHDVHSVEDERIEFRIRFQGQPPPEISWFKDGYEIFSSRRTKIVSDNDISVLIIHQVALTDQGEIRCTATNRVGHVVTRAHLFVQAPPKIRLPRTYEDGLIVEAEEILRLKVGIAGQPSPTISWFHEGEIVKNAGRYEIINTERNSLLKIDNTKRDDRGEYSVKATNKLGEDIAAFLVTVTARPSPPGKVRLSMSFGKSATLSWTAPIDDGGCKIGNYIVEYFRVGWNVWLKAATTRSLSTTLHDLIEGSEYKFRVKAENPYGLSDPSEESDVLFIPDLKRGITKPKSENKLSDPKQEDKPLPPRRKTVSPPARLVSDATTETILRMSPQFKRKPKPELLDNEELQIEMSYGTSDKALKIDKGKNTTAVAPTELNRNTPNTHLNIADRKVKEKSSSPKYSPNKLAADIYSSATSPPRSMSNNALEVVNNLPSLIITNHKSPQHSPQRPASIEALKKSDSSADVPIMTIEKIPTPEEETSTSTRELTTVAAEELQRKHSLTPEVSNMKGTANNSVPPSPSPTINKRSPALQRSSEPVDLGDSQQVGNYTNNTLLPNPEKIEKNINHQLSPSPNRLQSKITSSEALTIQINTTAITENLLTPNGVDSKNTERSPLTSETHLSNSAKHDDVHTSNEFMLVVFDKNSKVKDKDKQDSFELDLEEAIQPPPISISAPDLAMLEYTTLHDFPIRRSVSSTELLYERAMARFYEAVELENAEKARKLKATQDKISESGNLQPTTIRKRLASITEAERLSFEKRSELRRFSADIAPDSTFMQQRIFKENLNEMKSLTRATQNMLSTFRDSQETEEEPEVNYISNTNLAKEDSYELASDYTESTASSDRDSIQKFKMELMAHTKLPSPNDLETYHPADMSAGVFTPYRTPTPDEAALVLTRPCPLPSPDFVPKPILKRPSNESVVQTDSNGKSDASAGDKFDVAKSIKSFFKREKRPNTSKAPNGTAADKANAEIAETKRKIAEEEMRKRKEAERIMMEEARAAADHYSELVEQISTTRKYHTPIYMDPDGLMKVTDKETTKANMDENSKTKTENISKTTTAAISDVNTVRTAQTLIKSTIKPTDTEKQQGNIATKANREPIAKPTNAIEAITSMRLINPIKPNSEDKTKLETRSLKQSEPTTGPAAEPMPKEPQPTDDEVQSTVISETVEERPDERGRPRLVKVKRILKKRISSSTRSREASQSRPPSLDTRNTNNNNQVMLPSDETITPESLELPKLVDIDTEQRAIPEAKTAEQLSAEAQETVRSTISYSTDFILFIVACYLYLFKDSRLVLPILALMIYRQLGEAINSCIPNWLKRKQP